MDYGGIKQTDLRSDSGLVKAASASPISDHKEAQRPIGFGRLVELLKLGRYERQSSHENDDQEEKNRSGRLINVHGFQNKKTKVERDCEELYIRRFGLYNNGDYETKKKRKRKFVPLRLIMIPLFLSRFW